MRRKLIRYFVVGAIAAVVDYSVFFLAIKLLELSWFLSAISSFFISTLANYELSSRYVFKQGIRFKRHHELTLVLLGNAVTVSINIAVLGVTIEWWHWPLFIAKTTAVASVFLFNFAWRHFFVFKEAHTFQQDTCEKLLDQTSGAPLSGHSDR